LGPVSKLRILEHVVVKVTTGSQGSVVMRSCLKLVSHFTRFTNRLQFSTEMETFQSLNFHYHRLALQLQARTFWSYSTWRKETKKFWGYVRTTWWGFRPKREGETGRRKKLHSEETHTSFSSLYIVNVIISRKIRLMGHVVSRGKWEVDTKLLSEDLKGRDPVSLIEHQAMKAYWGSGAIPSRILDLGTSWRWAVSFRPRPLYSQGKNS